MTLDELRNLDPSSPGEWPTAIKAVALAVVIALVVTAAWYFQWQTQMDTLEQAKADEGELRVELDNKQRRAANLDAYKKQLAEMRDTFGDMLRQLPSRAEVAELLIDISQSGLAAGLEFELFQPEDSIKQEFYAERPVSIRVRGGYHEFASFISAVANLPRIVTLHGIEIASDDNNRGNNDDAQEKPGKRLTMNLTAKTYWYLEDAPVEAQ